MTTASAAAALEERIRAALNEVQDPCSVVAGVPAGIVDMGLVRSLEVRSRARTARSCASRSV